MTMKIETTATSQASAATLGGLPNAAQIFSLLDQLKGRKVDAGTAELVAKLTRELRRPELSRSTSVELRFSDDFHEGFANNVEDLSAQLKREGEASLEISYVRGPAGSTMKLELAGAREAVEAAAKEIEQAAGGAVELRWN